LALALADNHECWPDHARFNEHNRWQYIGPKTSCARSGKTKARSTATKSQVHNPHPNMAWGIGLHR
ncbi:MAG: hypothetical protein ABJD57_13925, partial [Roseibium sp.]|uniref:hypothetical protein n=1 Tax=Roseibium sp. TaxID=1936156 RepID=UPI003267A1EA